MVLAREMDDRRLKLQRQGRIGTFGPTTGQEAATCAPASQLSDRDWMVVSFREAPAQEVAEVAAGLPIHIHRAGSRREA